MLGPMITFDEELNENVPWIHKLWVYPLFWLGIVIIAFCSAIFGVLLVPFAGFLDAMHYDDAKWYQKAIGWPINILFSVPPFLGFLFISPIGWVNKYYERKEYKQKGRI